MVPGQPTPTAATPGLATRWQPPPWVDVSPGLQRRPTAAGPWFQYGDTTGFEWNAYELAVPGLPPALAGFRIVHLSDLHCRAGVWQAAYDELHDRLADDEPDLLVLTGDVADDVHRPHRCLPVARRVLAGLRARLGVFGQLGNHDRYLRPSTLAGTPLRLIDGRRVLLDAGPGVGRTLGDRTTASGSNRGGTGGGADGGGPYVELIATPGPMHEDMPHRFPRSLPPRTPGVPRVVLSHYPDHLRRFRPARPDLFLAGHTHGGQMCLPGRLPLLRHDSYPWRLRAGVHRVGPTWLVVSRGLGFSLAPVRLFCPAEVIDLTLVAGGAGQSGVSRTPSSSRA